MVEAEVGLRAEQARAGRRWKAIDAVTKFDEEVEHPFRHWPAEGAVAAKLGGRVIGNEENIRPVRVGRYRPELVLKDAEAATAAQLVGNEANGNGSLAGGGGKLKVRHHHLAERVKH